MRYAKTRFAGVLAAVGLAAASVYGTDLNVSVRSEGSNTVTVAPGAIVVYEVSGILSDSLNEGLALVLFDLSFSGGDLAPADTPAAPPMNNFALNLGITNPDGFGGTVINGDLIQVCGAQNTINNTPANAAFPVGSVIVDLAQSELVVVTGSLTAPVTPGEYTLTLSNLASTVIVAGEDGMPFWATETGGVGTIDNLTITVTAETIDPPAVVAEGRRVIANIERVANLYVSKTVYAFALVLAVGLTDLAFPFLPRHLTLVGSLTIGIPSFFLALERPSPRARAGFVSRVMKFAVPTGIIAALSTFLAFGLAESEVALLTESRTVATMVLFSVGLFVLAIGMRPLTGARSALLWAMAGLFALTILTDSGRSFFELSMPRAVVSLAAIGVVAITGALMYFALRASGWIRHVPEVVKTTQARVRTADPGRGKTVLERTELVFQALLSRSPKETDEDDP